MSGEGWFLCGGSDPSRLERVLSHCNARLVTVPRQNLRDIDLRGVILIPPDIEFVRRHEIDFRLRVEGKGQTSNHLEIQLFLVSKLVLVMTADHAHLLTWSFSYSLSRSFCRTSSLACSLLKPIR